MSNTYFTACSNGEYGGNCIHKCSENCGNGEVCDKVHGHCASCIPGFQGLQCNESKNSKLYIFLLRSPEYKTIKCLMNNKNNYYVGTLFAYDSFIIHTIQFTQHYDQSNNTLLHLKVPCYRMLGPTTCIYTFRSRNSNVIEHLKSCRT